MSHRAWFLFTAAIIFLACAGFWLANLSQPRPPAVSPSSQTATPATPTVNDILAIPEKPSLQPLFENLSSPDPALKTAALQQLAQLPPDRRNDLRAYAAQTLLPDVTTLLARRADEMDAQIALDPPPISLHVHAAGLNEVASSLTLATGVELQAIRSAGDHAFFSLDRDPTPFWEIIAALYRQSPLGISSNTDSFKLVSPGITSMRTSSIRGPFILFSCASSTRDTLSYGLAADPRTPLMAQRLRWTIVDTTGRKFDIPDKSPPAAADSLQPHQAFSSLNLKPFYEAYPDARIAACQVHARVAVGLKLDAIEIADVESHINDSVSVGRSLASVLRREFPQDSGCKFFFSATHDTHEAFASFRFLDGGGRTFAADCFFGSDSAFTSASGPFTLKVRVASEIKILDLDFELQPPL